MISGIYATYDKELELFSPIYAVRNDKMAIRSFKEFIKSILNNPNSPQDPEQIVLFKLGTFDDENINTPITTNKMTEIWHYQENETDAE